MNRKQKGKIRIHSNKKEKKKLKRQVDKRPPPHRSQSISSPKCCTSLGMPHSIYIDEAFEKRSLSQIRALITHSSYISRLKSKSLALPKNYSSATDVSFPFRNGGIDDYRSTIIVSRGNQRDRAIERFFGVTRAPGIRLRDGVNAKRHHFSRIDFRIHIPV